MCTGEPCGCDLFINPPVTRRVLLGGIVKIKKSNYLYIFFALGVHHKMNIVCELFDVLLPC